MKSFLLAVVSVACIALVGCDQVTTKTSTGGLSIEDVKTAATKDGPAVSDNTFARGAPVFVTFTVKGFKRAADDDVWVQEDLLLDAPDGTNVLTSENIVDLHDKAPKGVDEVPSKANFTIPDSAPAGIYKVRLNVRDKIAGSTASAALSVTLK